MHWQLLLLCFAMTTANANAVWAPGFYPVRESGTSNPRLKELHADIETADEDVTLYGTDKFDLGIGPLNESGARIPRLIPLSELRYYFARRNRTGFIVVHLSIAVEGHDKEVVTAVKSYFEKLGYTRILFLRPHAFGTTVHEDYRARSK